MEHAKVKGSAEERQWEEPSSQAHLTLNEGQEEERWKRSILHYVQTHTHTHSGQGLRQSHPGEGLLHPQELHPLTPPFCLMGGE